MRRPSSTGETDFANGVTPLRSATSRSAPGALAWGLCATVLLAACTSSPPPAAPTDLTATPSPGAITLTWTDRSDDEQSFAVLRSQGGEDPIVVATAPADTTTFLDAAVSPDLPATYWVEAVNAGGRSRSDPSNAVRAGVGGVPIVDPSDPVGVALNTLGIDTTATPRLGEGGDPLPEDYVPFGPRVTLGAGGDAGARYELFIGGAATSGSAMTSNQVVWEANGPAEALTYASVYGLGEDVFDLSALDAEHYEFLGGDVDGDGLDELLLVSLTSADQLTLSILDDAADGFARVDHALGPVTGATGVAATTGDFDADGVHTVVIGLGGSGSARLLFLGGAAEGFAVDEARGRTFDAFTPGASLTLDLAAGNIDYDPRDELAVVVNESFSTSGKASGSARHVVFDDALTGFEVLATGPVAGEDGGSHQALVADVGIGDVDADGRAEVVFAGLTEFHDVCSTYDLLYVVLDDAAAADPLSELGARLRTVSMGGSCTAAKVKRLRYVHLELGDVDADGIDEIVGGPMVFDDWTSPTGPWTELGHIPADQMYGHGVQDDAATISRVNSALAVLDMDGDGASEVVSYMPRAEAVIRYVLPASGGALTPRTWWTVDFSESSNGSRFRPGLVALNVDQDSLVAHAVPETYRFTITEPIIVAALAGAPCHAGTSQVSDACGTSFGTSESQGTSKEFKVTTSTSASIGFKVQGGAATQSELEIKGTLSRASSAVRGSSYELEKSVVYATGPLEDAVIFTTIGYDTFTYVVTQHPDPTVIGKQVQVSLPRDPVTLIVERSFFNDAQVPGALLVDDAVFTHSVGDPASYRTPAERDALLAHIGSEFGRDALSNGPVNVGQGTGSTQVAIDVSESSSTGGALEVGFQLELQGVAATVLAGFTVGISAEASFSWSHGTSTSYSASVGNIADPTEFANDRYAYGMFTYVHEDPVSGQQFEVIDFWVE